MFCLLYLLPFRVEGFYPSSSSLAQEPQNGFSWNGPIACNYKLKMSYLYTEALFKIHIKTCLSHIYKMHICFMLKKLTFASGCVLCASLKKQVLAVVCERWASLTRGTYFPRKGSTGLIKIQLRMNCPAKRNVLQVQYLNNEEKHRTLKIIRPAIHTQV